VLDDFRDPRGGNFAGMRILRYRRLTPADTDTVLARFDDGAAALVERQVGNGRVMAFTSTFGGDWNNVPRQSMFLPLLHEVSRYLGQYEAPEAWRSVGRMLDISAPVAALVRLGEADPGLGATAVVVAPSGDQTRLGQDGASSLELREQGFYSVRLAGSGNRRPYVVAVNIEPAESDLTPLVTDDFLAGITNRPAADPAQAVEPSELTPADIEGRQSLWWFLLVVGLALLFAESVLSNRQARRAGGPLGSATRPASA
jgi:hypothetical protein